MNKDIYTQKIIFFNNELEKIGKILSNLTDGTGVLLTIAGLLSFLPPLLTNSGSEHLHLFLLWTFPFILISIATYYPASLRVSSIIKGCPFASIGSDMELDILKSRAQYLELVWKKSVENHDSVLFWNKLTKNLIYAYIFSMVSNFYVLVFYGKPSLCTSVILLVVSCLITTSLLIWQKIKSKKNKIIGGST